MNIYQIQVNLQSLFDEIEECGGEMTSEQEEQLAITQEEFKDKMLDYQHVIVNLNKDVDSIDEEINRLKRLKESKQKLIDKLKKVMIEAIIRFGDVDKKGIYRLDLGTCKFSTRKSQVIKEYEDDNTFDIINDVIKEIGFNMQYHNDGNYTLNKIDIVNAINAAKFNNQDLSSPVTAPIDQTDLDDINITMAVKVPLDALTTEDGSYLLKNLSRFVNSKFKSELNKVDLKNKLQNDSSKASNLARLETNYSLQIK